METTDIPVKINTITFSITDPKPNTITVRLEHNGKRITRKMRPNAEGVLSFVMIDTMIKKLFTERIHIVANTEIGKITIKSSDDIKSSALFLLGHYPIILK